MSLSKTEGLWFQRSSYRMNVHDRVSDHLRNVDMEPLIEESMINAESEAFSRL